MFIGLRTIFKKLLKRWKVNPGRELYNKSKRHELSFWVDGLAVCGVLNLPQNLEGPFPLVITMPGWKGDRKGIQKYHLGIELINNGWAYLRLDPPGFGMSDGNAQVIDLNLNSRFIQAAISAVIQLPEIDASRIVLHGVSVGGSAVIKAAAVDDRIRALILWAPRSDYSDTAPDLYWVTSRNLVNTNFRNSGLQSDFYGLATQFKGSVLIIHGLLDTIVSPEQSQRLLQAFTSSRGVGQPLATMVSYKQGDHVFRGMEDLLISNTISFIKELRFA